MTTNIIYLITRFRSNMGPINQALNLVTGFDKNRVRIIIVTLSPEIVGQSWMNRFENENIEIIHLNKKSYDILGCVSSLKKIIRENNIHIVHSSGFRPDLCNSFLRKDVLSVTTQRSEPINLGEKYGVIWQFVMNKIEMYVLRKITIVVACSKSLSKSISLLMSKKIYYVQNGVNIDLFVPCINKNTIRKSFNLPCDKTLYIVLGSLLPRKNVGLILDCFITGKIENSFLLIVGDGILLEDYKKKYVSSDIFFMGLQKHPLPLIQCADYFISASLSEGLPNSVLESLACGVPVILSNIDSHLEILQEKEIGCSFMKYDSFDLLTAINKLKQSNYEILSKRCREVSEVIFSKYSIAHKYLELYNHHLHNG